MELYEKQAICMSCPFTPNLINCKASQCMAWQNMKPVDKNESWATNRKTDKHTGYGYCVKLKALEK